MLIRLPSLLLGTALVPLVYLLGPAHRRGARGADRRPPLIALSPFAIYYSSEARPYATLTLLRRAVHLAAARGARRRAARAGGRLRGHRLRSSCTPTTSRSSRSAAQGALGARGPAATGGARSWLANAGIVVGYLPVADRLSRPEGEQHLDPRVLRAAHRARRSSASSCGSSPDTRASRPSELPGARLVVHRRGSPWRRRRGAASGVSPPSRCLAPGRRLARLVLVALLALATPVGFTLYTALGPEVFIGGYMNGALPGSRSRSARCSPRRRGRCRMIATAVVVGSLAWRRGEPARRSTAAPPTRTPRTTSTAKARARRRRGTGWTSRSAPPSPRSSKGGRELSLDVNFDRAHDLISVFEENDIVPAFAQAARRPRLLLVGPAPLPHRPHGLGRAPWAAATSAGRCRSRCGSTTPPTRRRVRHRGPGDVPSVRRAAGGAGGCTAPLPGGGRLPPRRAETSPPGSIALEVNPPGGARALLFAYPSADRAGAELPAIERFLEAAGGARR